MSSSHDILQELLLGESAFEESYDLIKSSQNFSSSKAEKFEHNYALKVCIRYAQLMKGIATIKDFSSTLRNYILFSSKKISVAPFLQHKLEEVAEQFHLRIDQDGEANVNELSPKWLKELDHLSNVYELQTDHSFKLSIGDPTLHMLTGFSHYRSFEQKLCTHTALSLNSGYTLLCALPTGAGKSLIGQLFAYKNPGLSIVIVPTVALAIDQMESSRKLFEKAENYLPEAYYSGLAPIQKQNIFTKINKGKLPILYI